MGRAVDDKGLVSMSLGDHLEELRARLIITVLAVLAGLIICVFFGRFFISLLTSPYNRAMNLPAGASGLQTIQPAEGFIVYIKICLFFGILVASPVVFWQLWQFVAAGLYRHEKKFVHIVAPISATLFVTGALFFLLAIAPLAMGFFIKFNEKLELASNWTFQSYINMILALTLVFGAAFQMPIAIVFAERLGLVSVGQLKKARRYIILGLVVVAAIATPPDPVSQLALAAPLYILFEASLIVCRLMGKKTGDSS